MKWGIIVLLILGVIAALCAAILIGTLHLNIFGGKSANAATPAEITDIVVAARYLPALTVITAECIETTKIPKTELPNKGRPLKLKEALGSVNLEPLVEGQILTESSFGWGGTGPEIIAKLDPNMVAYTIHMPRLMLPDMMFLYPGCVADVLFVPTRSRNNKSQSPPRALLERVRVMAVSGRTQFDDANPNKKENRSSTSTRGTVAVTLEVTQRQAIILAVSEGDGRLSLAIRNLSNTSESKK